MTRFTTQSMAALALLGTCREQPALAIVIVDVQHGIQTVLPRVCNLLEDPWQLSFAPRDEMTEGTAARDGGDYKDYREHGEHAEQPPKVELKVSTDGGIVLGKRMHRCPHSLTVVENIHLGDPTVTLLQEHTRRGAQGQPSQEGSNRTQGALS
jgi:hypothetical protein